VHRLICHVTLHSPWMKHHPLAAVGSKDEDLRRKLLTQHGCVILVNLVH